MQNQSDYGHQPPPNKTLSCSFCGKGQDEVKKLIAGPSVYICDECIGICNEIIAGKERAIDLHKKRVDLDQS